MSVPAGTNGEDAAKAPGPRREPHVVYDPSYEVDIGPHVFPTLKYRLVRERLLADGIIAEQDLIGELQKLIRAFDPCISCSAH